MDAPKLLWKQWQEQVKQLLSGLHGHQQKAFALCVLGIIVSGSAVLQRIAEGLAEQGLSQAKMPRYSPQARPLCGEPAHRGRRGVEAVARAGLTVLARQTTVSGAGLYALW